MTQDDFSESGTAGPKAWMTDNFQEKQSVVLRAPRRDATEAESKVARKVASKVFEKAGGKARPRAWRRAERSGVRQAGTTGATSAAQ